MIDLPSQVTDPAQVHEPAAERLFRGAGGARALARAVPWIGTALGPVAGWPAALMAAVRLSLASPLPTAIWAGPELTLIHNDAYLPLLGAKATWAMGCPAREVWAEVWATLAPDFAGVLERGAPVRHEDAPFVLRRYDREEEGYFTFSLSPIPGDDGRAIGIYNVAQETSSSVVALRRIERALREREAESRRQLAELQSIYDSAHVGLCVFDRDLRFVRVNHRLAEMNGVPAADHLGKTVAEIVPSLAPTAQALVDRILRTGAPVVDVEITGTTPSMPGVQRAFVEQWFPLKDASGVVTGVNVVAEEVTERRRAEEALRASEDRLRAMADALPALVFVHDSDGSSTYVNQRYLEYTGRRPDGLLGKAHADLIHPEDAERVAAGFRDALARRQPFESEYRLRRADGAWRWHLVRSVPWRHAADGAPLEWVGTAIDITDLKAAEQRLSESERRYAAMFRRSPLAKTLSRLPGGILADVNDAWEALTGISRDEAMGRTAAELGLVDAEEQRRLEAGLLADAAVSRELRVETRGRGPRLLLTHAQAVGLGGDAFMLAVMQDVTELRRTERALRDSEERLSTALEASQIGTWEYDAETHRAEWSPQCRRLLGVPGEGPVEYERFLEAVHPEDRAAADAAVRRALQPDGDGVFSAQYRVRWPDGTVRWVSAFGRAHHEEQDGVRRPRRMLGAVVDVTQEKEAELALRDADRRKTEFLAVLSHELRNPLAPIRNSIVLLESAAADSPTASRARDILRRQTDHLVRLVDDLLDLSRIAHGKYEIRLARQDVRELVRKAYLDAKGLFDVRDVELLLSDHPEPLWVEADGARFSQLIGNLLHNALKFTPPRGRVEVKTVRRGASCEVRVKDSGQGIEPGDLERIFDPFEQALRTRDGGGGLGLGLALVKGLAEKHGGTVRAHSEGPGKGAEFVVALPLAGAPASSKAVTAGTAPRSARPLAILIIEDNEDAAATLADLLSLGGHTVTTAGTGRAGVDAVAAQRPDVVICDVGLPDMSGYEVIREIRRAEAGRRVFAAALTGYAQPQDREAALAAGFDAHLPKPPPLEALEALLAGAPRWPPPAADAPGP